MRAKDLMQTDVLTVREDESVSSLIDVLVGEHIHGAPVVGPAGQLVGVVTQQDIFFGTMTHNGEEPAGEAAEAAHPESLKIRDIMTSPAVSATENTRIKNLCDLMYKLRIHRVPILREDGKIAGIVCSLDLCGAIARGETLS